VETQRTPRCWQVDGGHTIIKEMGSVAAAYLSVNVCVVALQPIHNCKRDALTLCITPCDHVVVFDAALPHCPFEQCNNPAVGRNNQQLVLHTVNDAICCDA